MAGISASEMGRRGAKVTNKMLTTSQRSKAAKKGWRRHKKELKEKSFTVKTKK